MKKEIGSYFWSTEEDISLVSENLITPEMFGCNGSDYIWLSTGRSAIALVINTIEKINPNIFKRVCLPAFTCHTVFEPFLKAGYEVITIPVGKDLDIPREILEEYVWQYRPGIVLLHNYFGFDTLKNIKYLIPNIRSRGVVVIEDITQCIYSTFPRLNADYWIGSIRKWSGMPDGAIAVCNRGKFFNKPHKYDKDLEKAAIEASLLKRKYMEEGVGEKSTFLKKYKIAESILAAQSEIYLMSPKSSKIQSNLNRSVLSQKRRINYTTLERKLTNIKGIKPVFEYLDNDSVPLYFPIYCEQRDELQRILISHDIYAPIVWPKANNIPYVDTNSNDIYNHILCIPIDQRYDEEDMKRVVEVINNYSKL